MGLWGERRYNLAKIFKSYIAGSHHEQFWLGQWCPLSGVAHLAFLLLTMGGCGGGFLTDCHSTWNAWPMQVSVSWQASKLLMPTESTHLPFFVGPSWFESRDHLIVLKMYTVISIWSVNYLILLALFSFSVIVSKFWNFWKREKIHLDLYSYLVHWWSEGSAGEIFTL